MVSFAHVVSCWQTENTDKSVNLTAGTAACILASRLQVADPSLSILMIEEGRDNYQDVTVRTPALFLSHVLPDSNSAVFVPTRATKEVGGRSIIVPRPSILGGGSSINFMMYARAQAIDFDEWRTEGWSHKEMLPLLKKLETHHADTKNINNGIHGTNGPINISKGTWPKTTFADDFLQAASKCGLPEVDDLQDFESVRGAERMLKYISPEGIRQDTAHAYLHPLLHDQAHPNLYLLLNTTVRRVLFNDENQATGVEFVSSKGTPDLKVVKAKRLVVMCCGALGSSAVLERSGIGRKELLEQLGIKPIVDLRGVGQTIEITPLSTSLIRLHFQKAKR